MQQSYLSPKRYVLGGYGIGSNLTAAQTRQKLVQATNMVDSWCNRPMNPSRADMRGGAIEGEQHSWPVTGPLIPAPMGRRIYLNAGPIRTVTAFSIQYTNTWELTLPGDNLFINATEGYIEIVATQPTIIGYPPVGIWFGLSEPVMSVSYTYGWQFDVADDPLEAESPLLWYASNGNWLEGGTVEVTVDGSVVDPGNYTVNTDDGSILFDQQSQPAADATVLASYTYVLPQQVASAVGIIATDLIGESNIARRGLIGLSSIKVAEVSLTRMGGPGGTDYVTKNGIRIPADAAALLEPYALGSIG